tara:strand:+ start:1765 stop:2109 length:345 start_codon:yes stop_codon:yes gene_type:complete
MRFFLIFIVFFSCSNLEEISIDSKRPLYREFFINFLKNSNNGVITDRYSCLGWSEIMGCELNSKNYLEGTNIEVWAIPNEGYKFIGWSGSYNSQENPLIVTVDSDKEIIAMFSE